MVGRQATLTCLFCQAGQLTLADRRHAAAILKRGFETRALRPDEDGIQFHNEPLQVTRDGAEAGPVLELDTPLRRWKVQGQVDAMREAALEFEALWKLRDFRLEVLRNLSNPWPDRKAHRAGWTPRATGAPILNTYAGFIPLPIFRQNIKQAVGRKAIRQVLREQLLRCEWTSEILRVVAVALQNAGVAAQLAALDEPIMRALYRSREHVSDAQVLKTLTIMISRFRHEGLPVRSSLLFMALKFAARARSLPAMKKYLRTIREANLDMSANTFRAVVAKFSIGMRGLGEIRNGRWYRRELLQVLTGFDDEKHLPDHQQNHLGVFLDRNDWQFLHGWLVVLGRCRDSDRLWQEWRLWKESDSSKVPKLLLMGQRTGQQITSKMRGDHSFVEQMVLSGDTARAWQILKESGVEFRTLKPVIKGKLIQNMEQPGEWDEEMRAEVVSLYDRELAKIEEAFGVRWIPGAEDGDGRHEVVVDQETTLEALGSGDWKLEEDYGYPWDNSLVMPHDRALHDAAESTPA